MDLMSKPNKLTALGPIASSDPAPQSIGAPNMFPSLAEVDTQGPVQSPLYNIPFTTPNELPHDPSLDGSLPHTWPPTPTGPSGGALAGHGGVDLPPLSSQLPLPTLDSLYDGTLAPTMSIDMLALRTNVAIPTLEFVNRLDYRCLWDSTQKRGAVSTRCPHGYLFAPRDEGGVHVIIYDGGGTRELTVSLNPSKVNWNVLPRLVQWLGSFGLSAANMLLARVDVAVDYSIARELLLLDRRRGKSVFVGPTDTGYETEWYGKGWTNQKQLELYDKRAERASKGETDLPSEWSRFEVRVKSPKLDVAGPGGVAKKQTMRLGQLQQMPWPFPNDRLRRFAVLPTDDVTGLDGEYLAMAGEVGLANTIWSVDKCHSKHVVAALLDYLPEVTPQPHELFAAGWGELVFEQLSELCPFHP